ncbi:MAG: hypothetical protein IJZ23_00060 [Roseburia sp.]|nr:hypothetical protein [Roseburia sp.]
MRKKYIGETSELSLINGKVYEVLGVSRGWYRIVDETGEDYLYPPHFFVDEGEEGYVEGTPSDFIEAHLVGEISNEEVIW